MEVTGTGYVPVPTRIEWAIRSQKYILDSIIISVNLRGKPGPRGFSEVILTVNQRGNQGHFTGKKCTNNPRGLKFI